MVAIRARVFALADSVSATFSILSH